MPSFTATSLLLAAHLLQASPRPDEFERQLSNGFEYARLTETLDAGAVAEPRTTDIYFFRRWGPDPQAGKALGWLAVRSVKGRDGQAQYASARSGSCPQVATSVEILSGLDLPQWEISDPKPLTPGRELLPTILHRPTYEATVRVFPQDGYPMQLTVSAYTGPVAADRARVMESLAPCWVDGTVDLIAP